MFNLGEENALVLITHRAHLYRTHRIFKCERCNELFKDSDTLKSHFMATKACDLRQTDPIDGITCDVEKKLKIRKKTHKNQSPGERWKEIYSIIFPMELVPEPCKLFSFFFGSVQLAIRRKLLRLLT